MICFVVDALEQRRTTNNEWDPCEFDLVRRRGLNSNVHGRVTIRRDGINGPLTGTTGLCGTLASPDPNFACLLCL